MPSDLEKPRRLHPVSVVFNLAGEVKAFAIPALLLIFGAGSSDAAWRLWGGLLIIPAGIAAFAKYFKFTYTYGADELIVRSGILFKRERHIPYARIQNIDATQNLAHALFGVYSVALETGSGDEAEASLSVMPEEALNEMRRRVFEGRRAPREQEAAAAEPGVAQPCGTLDVAPQSDVLLRLGLRELAICGFVRGRGLLLLGAIAGVASQFGLDDQVFDAAEDPEKRGPIASAVRGIMQWLSFDVMQIVAAIVVFVILILILRLFSVIYTIQKLHGFSLIDAEGELRMSYGLLTRVKATIPLRRIQTVTVREGPLHRLFGVTSVRADTAGGEANAQAAGSREWLAPVIPHADLPRLLERLIPGATVDDTGWDRPHPRAVRRACVRSAVPPVAVIAFLGWYASPALLVLAIPVIAAAYAVARKQMRHMGHRVAGDVFMFRSGWIWRHVTLAPLGKVQGTGVVETPFDRRHGMAALIVDTAGAAGSPHRLDVPYLDRAVAHARASVIGARAAGTALNW